MNNVRMLVVEIITMNDVELKPDRIVRIDPACMDAYKEIYGDKVKMWINWPNKPEIFREDSAMSPKMPVGWTTFKVPELKQLAKGLGLSDAGIKEYLIERIVAFETAQSK